MADVMQRERKEKAGWEHHQIDILVGPEDEGMACIHCFDRLDLTLFGLIKGGKLIDLILSSRLKEEEIVTCEPPAITLAPESEDALSLTRSWQLGTSGLVVQAYVWIDHRGGGLADLFVGSVA